MKKFILSLLLTMLCLCSYSQEKAKLVLISKEFKAEEYSQIAFQYKNLFEANIGLNKQLKAVKRMDSFSLAFFGLATAFEYPKIKMNFNDMQAGIDKIFNNFKKYDIISDNDMRALIYLKAEYFIINRLRRKVWEIEEAINK